MNCKPGDMAILICASLDVNIGKIAMVGSRARDHDTYGPMWLIECDSILFCTSWDGTETRPVTKRNLFCPDAWLRPVSGLPVTDDIDTEIPA